MCSTACALCIVHVYVCVHHRTMYKQTENLKTIQPFISKHPKQRRDDHGRASHSSESIPVLPLAHNQSGPWRTIGFDGGLIHIYSQRRFPQKYQGLQEVEPLPHGDDLGAKRGKKNARGENDEKKGAVFWTPLAGLMCLFST